MLPCMKLDILLTLGKNSSLEKHLFKYSLSSRLLIQIQRSPTSTIKGLIKIQRNAGAEEVN